MAVVVVRSLMHAPASPADARVRRMAGDRFGMLVGLVAVAVSIAIYLVNTRHGIAILVDSTRYLGMLEGYTYDAPLYTWLVTLVAYAGLTMPQAAEVFGLVIVAANTALIWTFLLRATGRLGFALMGMALIIFAPQFIALHASAMSEPLFITMILVALLALQRFGETDRIGWLLACGVAIGLCALTRFPGVALGAAVAGALLLDPRWPLVQRFRQALVVGVTSGGIFLSWALASQLVAGRSVGRELAFHGNTGAHEWQTSFGAMTAWLMPEAMPLAVRVVLLAVFLGVAAFLGFRQSAEVINRPAGASAAQDLMPLVLGLFFVFYMAFILLSVSLEANLSFTGRYAFPPYVILVLLLTIGLARIDGGSIRKPGLVLFMAGLATIVLASHMVRASVRSADAYRSGVAYSSLSWASSPTMKAIARLPASTTIYSNGPDAVSVVLGRRALFVPRHVDPRTDLPLVGNSYEQQLVATRQRLAQGNAYVVFFDDIGWRFYLGTEAELRRQLGLRLVDVLPDGRIYMMPESDREDGLP